MTTTSPNTATPKNTADTAILMADWGDGHALSDIFGFEHDLISVHDKPLLQRAVEQLVTLGCRSVVLVLGDYASQHREFLGNGQRWGIQISYQYRRPGESLSTQMQTWIDVERSPWIWLADARCLPDALVFEKCGSFALGKAGCTVVSRQNGQPEWGGWGLFSSAWLASKPIPVRRAEMAELLLQSEQIELHESATLLQAHHPASFLAANLHLLGAGQPLSRIGRGCSISPLARIIPPVHLGERVRIGPDSVIGPHAVIGDNCLIDQDVAIESSVVLPGTYVGVGLELKHSVVGGNTVANTALDTVISIDNNSLLCALASRDAVTLADRLAAKTLRVMLAPLQWASRWRCRLTPELPEMGYQLSRAQSATPWALHFSRCFYPRLADVASGEMHLLGPQPRSRAELLRLPAPWRAIYKSNYPGLLSDALVREPDELGPDEQFASDAMAVASRKMAGSKMTLLARYLSLVVRDMLSAQTLPGQQESGSRPA